MKKAVIFGAGQKGVEIYYKLMNEYEIICFCDNNKKVINSTICSKPIKSLEQVEGIYECTIIIGSVTGLDSIYRQLVKFGINKNKIITKYVEYQVRTRERFLEYYSKLVYDKKIEGAVAEAGVFQGEFAKKINEAFHDRKLYLFDTFEGFDMRDLSYEVTNNFSKANVGNFDITSEELVLSKMRYVENCIIRKGYFPETAFDIVEKFCFVNLDMDLYNPTLEGLKYFYPKMNKGGIILIHDYFGENYKGVKQAVNEFIKQSNENINIFPVADELSIGIVK